MASVIATGDVPKIATDILRDVCRPFLDIKGRDTVRLFSAEPPSFIKLVADVVELATPLKLAAGALLTALCAQLGKHAADDLWKNKALIAKALGQTAATPLRTLVDALRSAKERSRSSTYVAIMLPVPDDDYGSMMVVPIESEQEAALALAIFLEQAEAVDAAIREQLAVADEFTFGVRLFPRGDGSIRLTWIDRRTNEPKERILPRTRRGDDTRDA